MSHNISTKSYRQLGQQQIANELTTSVSTLNAEDKAEAVSWFNG